MNKKVAQIICKAWNTLDANVLEPYLSDDFEYASVWVLERIRDKDRYLDYIEGKFENIRKSDKFVIADVLYQENIGKYIVVLNQSSNTVALEPTIQNGLIKKLWMRPIGMTLPAVFSSKPPIEAYSAHSPNQITSTIFDEEKIQYLVLKEVQNMKNKPENEQPWYMKSMKADSDDIIEVVRCVNSYFETNYPDKRFKWVLNKKTEGKYCDLSFSFDTAIFDVLIEYHYGNIRFLDIGPIEKLEKESKRRNHIPCIAAMRSDIEVCFLDLKANQKIDFSVY
jgi:hypothetical protein